MGGGKSKMTVLNDGREKKRANTWRGGGDGNKDPFPCLSSNKSLDLVGSSPYNVSTWALRSP